MNHDTIIQSNFLFSFLCSFRQKLCQMVHALFWSWLPRPRKSKRAHKQEPNYLTCITSGGSKGGAHPTGQNFLNFMQFFGKIWQICMLAPSPGGLAPPPTRNPGSAPDNNLVIKAVRFCSHVCGFRLNLNSLCTCQKL